MLAFVLVILSGYLIALLYNIEMIISISHGNGMIDEIVLEECCYCAQTTE